MNTMQQEFDAVVAHLYKQSAPAMKDDGFCAYRGDNGTMCAVGCRIPDEIYEPGMEGNQSDDLIEHFNTILPAEIVAYGSMFNRLQEVHDHWTFHGHDERMTFKEWLDQQIPQVAQQFSLTFTVPQ